jgi:hypothetical protein
MIDPQGVYDMAGLPLEVVPAGTRWKVRLPGAPDGYEPALRRLDDFSFEMERGPLAGAVLTFDDSRSGHVGPIPVRRLDRRYEEPPGYGLEPPPYSPDPDRDRAFQGLLERTEPGGRVEWDLPYPKHELVRWAQRLDRFIFHSSTNAAIEEFQPKRDSVELADHGGRGNLGAVYGTHDGYWSMFFGIVDRERLRGSMRNGVTRWETPEGRVQFTYQFSLEQKSLTGHPFTDGAVYLLPRETFDRIPFYPGGPLSDEWASQEPVRPIASLLISPSDFPFLDRVAGHDETEFLSMLDRFRELIAGAVGYEQVSEGLVISLQWDEAVESSYDRWVPLAGAYMPVVDHRIEGDGALRTLYLDGPDPYLAQVMKRLDENLAG